ncbi:hypothetical protein ALC56_13030, partial [Trachymyrmex septentrionalis]
YVGQTKRKLKTRFKEHIKDLNKPTNSLSIIACHKLENDDMIDWENFSILDSEHSYYKRMVSEMVHIHRYVRVKKSSYPDYTTVLNLADIELPITFEEFRNSKISTINVYETSYSIKNKQVLPLRLTDNKRDKHVNLLCTYKIHSTTALGTLRYFIIKKIAMIDYEYVDCVEKLQNTRLLPRELFYNSITGDTVFESDYAHAVSESDTPSKPRWASTYINYVVFGKTMENVRNHIDVKLITIWNRRYGAEAMIAKSNFHNRSVFAENLIAVEMCKLEVKFNKAIYVGICILDISKVCLYEFYHEYMLPMYREKCKIINIY